MSEPTFDFGKGPVTLSEFNAQRDQIRAEIEAMTCKHCGEAFKGELHTRTGVGRCDPQQSGLPYGYNAEAIGTACAVPCIGVMDGR